jgi:hypothetical protein
MRFAHPFMIVDVVQKAIVQCYLILSTLQRHVNTLPTTESTAAQCPTHIQQGCLPEVQLYGRDRSILLI